MPAMEPLATYDYLVRARRRLFDWIRPLDAGAYGRVFPFALGTLGATLTHILGSEWYYVQRLSGTVVPPYEEWRYRREAPLGFPALEAAWAEEAVRTRAALAAVASWTTELEYRVVDDSGVPVIVTATPGGIFTQLALHEVHHRAQALAMLAQMGIAIEGLDFNLMTYRRRPG
jgi:uncharacterized damage-inducible protein DinB